MKKNTLAVIAIVVAAGAGAAWTMKGTGQAHEETGKGGGRGGARGRPR
ncbi:hypothetical protein [Massilia sp. Dwa41.01b]|nr:hypothetical protein [Massilia sp. Dwa41.01b]